MQTIQTQITGWLIAGSIVSWLAYEMWGRGPLGMTVDWLVGLLGAAVGVFITPFIFWLVSFASAIIRGEVAEGLNWWQRVEGLNWWVSIPLASAGALLITRIFRLLFRVRSSP